MDGFYHFFTKKEKNTIDFDNLYFSVIKEDIDRSEDMKKVISASVLLSVVLVLSACGDKEYQTALQEGRTALENKNFELAITKFQKASELEPELTEPKALIESAEAAYFDVLYEKGNEALTLLAFPEAKDLYEKAYALDEVKQPDILEKKLKAEDLEKKQKQLDEYAKWVQKAAKINNQLSTEWRNASSNLSIGTITIPEFKEKMQLMLSTYQELLTSAENEILNISGELSGIHTNYLSKLQNNYEQNRLVIISTGGEEVKIEEVLGKGKDLNDIQSQHLLHIQALKSYAQAQGIVFEEK